MIKGNQLRGLRIPVALFCLILLWTGCGAPEAVTLGKDDNGRQVELAKGQNLTITLEGNPTTGYGWEVAEVDESILRQIGEIEYRPESDLIGAPSMATIQFEAVGAGQSPLELVYRRPWEEGVDPIDSFSTQVSVQ
jgi:inhibitor of cysteine peptidase